MTVYYCDHCGKKIWRITKSSDMSCKTVEDDAGAWIHDGETMIFSSSFILCKPCYNKYWEDRRKFDIDFFSEAAKEKNNAND